jgi:hypothetical protein
VLLLSLATDNAPLFDAKLERTSLAIIDVGTGEKRNFAERVGGDFILSTCWSPDGTMVAASVIDGAWDRSKEGMPLKTRIDVIELSGRLNRSIPLPDAPIPRILIGWR